MTNLTLKLPVQCGPYLGRSAGRVAGSRYGATNDQMRCTSRHRTFRRNNSALIACGISGQPNTRRHK